MIYLPKQNEQSCCPVFIEHIFSALIWFISFLFHLTFAVVFFFYFFIYSMFVLCARFAFVYKLAIFKRNDYKRSVILPLNINRKLVFIHSEKKKSFRIRSLMCFYFDFSAFLFEWNFLVPFFLSPALFINCSSVYEGNTKHSSQAPLKSFFYFPFQMKIHWFFFPSFFFLFILISQTTFIFSSS